MVAQAESLQAQGVSLDGDDHLEKTKTLICALNLLSRNLPLPQDVFDAVSSIYGGGESEADGGDSEDGDDLCGSDADAP
ncbi:hypothetical protein Acr_24g0003110 [Actinidia rufa]|uniref:Uncharacterized protein n=1 Tax=Actinidia rufa TaxID=165716 RepID=A0A7J0GTR4_9ERIC|nr:hypothetical protein Acr_24g0003110 [Actinidia rufa]